MTSVSSKRMNICLCDDGCTYLMVLEHDGREYGLGATFESMEIHGTAKEGRVVSLSSWSDEMASFEAEEVLRRPAKSRDELVTAAQMRNPINLPPSPEDWLWGRLRTEDAADSYDAAADFLPKELRPSSAEIVDCCKHYVENCRCQNCQCGRPDAAN